MTIDEYVRISSTDQNEDRHVEPKNIYMDKQSSKDFACRSTRNWCL